MNLVFKTGPGMFSARTSRTDQTIPKGKIRIYCARLEVYEIDGDNETDLGTTFPILPAMAEGKPEVAKQLIDLAKTIAVNQKRLRKELE